jgi:hypothetical protein
LLNPSEVAVLAHRPISGPTYFAAKLTYLVLVVVRVEAVLNGPAAVAGLVKAEARWFYPFTHMTAALCAGLFLALFACAIFGVLFRVMPVSRLRSAALWLQLVVALGPLLINVARRPMRSIAAALAPHGTTLDWSFLPITWFNALALVGQGGTTFSPGLAAAGGFVVSVLFIGVGIRSLSSRYMSRIVGVMRSTRAGRGGHHRPASPAARIVRVLARRPSGQAAGQFVWRLMRRDWQFRRAAAQIVLPVMVFAPAVMLSGRDVSPFDANKLPVVGILPELIPLITLAICLVLSYSDHYKGVWVFATAPAPGMHGYVRGVYWSIWVPFLGVPFVAVFVFFAASWGLLDAALFAAYGVAVASLLFGLQLLLVEGAPFGSAPRADRAHTMMPLILFGPVAIGIGWLLQAHFIFRNRLITVVATMVFAWGAKLAGQYCIRQLETRMHGDLLRQSDQPSRMFQGAKP